MTHDTNAIATIKALAQHHGAWPELLAREDAPVVTYAPWKRREWLVPLYGPRFSHGATETIERKLWYIDEEGQGYHFGYGPLSHHLVIWVAPSDG